MPPTTLSLWPDTPPYAAPDDNFIPYLESALHAEGRKRGLVLVFPGGGYGGRAPHEGMPVAKRFNEGGIHAAVVQYRVSPHRHPAPLLDAARAVHLVRQHADEWHIDPGRVAVLGFSAGGHLAASISTLHNDIPELPDYDGAALNCRPDAAILCYPVISSTKFGHQGSFNNLLGPDGDAEMRNALSLETRVDTNTPPTFLWHTAEDPAVPVENSLAYAAGLSRHDIPFELHVYPHGSHGVGLAPDMPHVATWTQLATEWLLEMGW